jgi:hypothetical protein
MVRDVVILDEGSAIASGTDHSEVLVFDRPSRDVIARLRFPVSEDEAVKAVAVREDSIQDEGVY